MTSINDEELRAGLGRGAMRFCPVRHLVADARCQDEFPAIGQLGVQFALEAQQDVSLLAPVIGQVAGAVLHHAHAEGVELLRAPGSYASFAFVFRMDNL